MNPEEFRYKNLTSISPDTERLKEILWGNYMLFMRRAADQIYGTAVDRQAAHEEAIKTRQQYHSLTGKDFPPP